MIGNPVTVALLGLPRTGKSTYLGALWQLAQDPAEPTIVERDVTGDRSYLQQLGEQVALGAEIGRTEVSSSEGMQLTLGFEQGEVRVDIPDLGGETLRLLVEERVWHRQLEGMVREDVVPAPSAWSARLVEAIAEHGASRLQRFLTTFGPAEVPEMATVGWLTRLYCHVEAGDCAAVREVLELRHSDRRSGRQLKEELFGRSADAWWTVSEAARLGTILGANRDAWDAEALALGRRFGEWIRVQGIRPLLQDLSSISADCVRDALVSALIENGTSADVAPVARIDAALVARWLAERPYVGREPQAWEGLDDEEAEAVWRALGSPDLRLVLAGVVSGHARAAIEVLGFGEALSSAVRAKDIDAAALLVEAGSWGRAARVAEGDAEVAVLLGAIAEGRDVPDVVEALEARRDRVDEVWLKAAANVIAGQKLPTGKVLEVVFGPLHQAITEDRLPPECWEALNPVLPGASDPALRLRRFLVSTAKGERWERSRYRRALRGAGPYASELYREFDDDALLLGRIRDLIERL